MTEPPRDPKDSTNRRRAFGVIALILVGLVLGIAGLWKLSHLIGTEPKTPRR